MVNILRLPFQTHCFSQPDPLAVDDLAELIEVPFYPLHCFDQGQFLELSSWTTHRDSWHPVLWLDQTQPGFLEIFQGGVRRLLAQPTIVQIEKPQLEQVLQRHSMLLDIFRRPAIISLLSA